MKIECVSVDELLRNLEEVPTDGLYLRAIMFRRVTMESPSGTRAKIVFQASCVVQHHDGSEYLLVLGQDCGTDYRDQGGVFEGSKKADVVQKKLEAVCAARGGWRMLPGMVRE